MTPGRVSTGGRGGRRVGGRSAPSTLFGTLSLPERPSAPVSFQRRWKLLCCLRYLPGDSACVVAGLAEAGPGSPTPATSFLPSPAKPRFACSAPVKSLQVQVSRTAGRSKCCLSDAAGRAGPLGPPLAHSTSPDGAGQEPPTIRNATSSPWSHSRQTATIGGCPSATLS